MQFQFMRFRKQKKLKITKELFSTDTLNYVIGAVLCQDPTDIDKTIAFVL